MAEENTSTQGISWEGVAGILLLVGFIVYLLWPGVNNVRTPARSTIRSNQMRNMLICVTQHDLAYGYTQATALQPQFEPEDRLSWIADSLPFIERNDLHQQIDFNLKWNDPKQSKATKHVMKVLYDISFQSVKPVTTYVGVSGLGKDAAYLKPSDPNAGIFLYNHKTSLDSVAEQDGLAHTLLILPTNSDIGPWAAGGRPTVRGLDIDRHPFLGFGGQFGGFHKRDDYLIIGFADQHINRISTDIDPKVFRAMFTKNGSETLDLDYRRDPEWMLNEKGNEQESVEGHEESKESSDN
ncbi:Hypothetical protein PBC10988_9270 [Planctomycetales bacterium 10988]|nr:Hypothetical protein PBC10988_9270 [Planctomycetales bacterium 10988]